MRKEEERQGSLLNKRGVKMRDRTMKKDLRKALPILLALLGAFFLSACGQEDEGHLFGVDGYVYVAEKVDLPEVERGMINELKAHDEKVYFINDGTVRAFPLGDTASVKTVCKAKFGTIADYVLDEEGKIYYLARENIMGRIPYAAIGCRLPDGKLVYESPVEDSFPLHTGGMMALIGEGDLVLLSSEALLLLNGEDGTVLDRLPTEEYRGERIEGNDLAAGEESLVTGEESLVTGEDGTAYYCLVTDGQPGMRLAYRIETDEAGHLNLAQEEIDPKDRGRVYGSPLGLLYDDGEDGFLYRYGESLASQEAMLYWGDSNLSPEPDDICTLSGDRLLVLTTWLMDQEAYLLTRTAVEDLPEKEILVFAAVTPTNIGLEQAVSAFNRQSDRYHVTLRLYTVDEVETRLNASLVSSSPPDLLDLTALDLLTYTDKQVLEDLSPYLEESDKVHEEDYLESVIEEFTIGGRLVSIPSEFSIFLYSGRASQVWETPGYTMEDLMELTEEHPNCRVLDIRALDKLLLLAYDYILERYVDWESGECRFESGEFRELMEWMGRNCRGIDYWEWENYEDSLEEYGWPPSEQLLLEGEYVSSFESWIVPETYGLVPVGYPSADGEVNYHMVPWDLIGIVSRSRHKEGAWEFLEYFLANAKPNAFPSRLDQLEQLEEEYVAKGTWVVYMYGKWQEIETTQEQVDGVLEMMEHMHYSVEGGVRSGIIDIVLEEMGSYLSGDKTLDEVLPLIQNRAQILVNEGL